MPSAPVLRAALAEALRSALRARDRDAVTALRGLSATWANAEAVPVDTVPRAGAIEGAAVGVGVSDGARRELSADDLVALTLGEIDEHEDAARHREGLGRGDDAAALRRQAAALVALLDAHAPEGTVPAHRHD